MVYQNFEQLLNLARKSSQKKKTVAVVAAQDSHTLEAVIHAQKEGFVNSVLIGDSEQIHNKLNELGASSAEFTIVSAENFEMAAGAAADLIQKDQADFIMKGMIPTSTLMKALLNEKNGFRTGNLISHISFVQIPNYHKLLGITDVALNTYPDLQMKKAIVENAVAAMRTMGFTMPKVAVLAASEEVSKKMPETSDGAALQSMSQKGELGDCLLEGPMSYDLAMSKEAAAIKGMASLVSGDADLLVVPNIAAGNILLKALRYSAGAVTAGFVIGGKTPIVLTSRAADVESKYLPLALAACAAGGFNHAETSL